MEVVALVLAGLALVIALVAWAKTSGQAAAVKEAATEARRRSEGIAEESDRHDKNLRMLVAALAEGEALTREQVLEGILWHDVGTKRGVEMVAEGDMRILDVRTPEETAAGVIPGATLIPVEELEERYREFPPDPRTTLIYCAGGVRSTYACEILANKGHTKLYNLSEGFMGWNGPVERPGKD
jgi:rhodanese-related sulfurtransferase